MTTEKTTKYKIFLITWKHFVADKGRIVNQDVYVGSTTGTLNAALKKFTTEMKANADLLNDNFKKARVVDTELHIIQVSTATVLTESSVINRYIDKYNTMNSGWNPNYR